MRIMDLINSCDFSAIRDKIQFFYGERDLNKYEKLFNKLKTTQPNAQPKEQMCIFITAFREIEDEEIIIDDFDENDHELYFDVSAYDAGIDEEMVYSIAATNYSNFLSYTVDEKTLNNFSPESILAHSFYEITAYGFEDNI